MSQLGWRDPSLRVVLAITAACLLPFAGKAFHVDDPSFLWGAMHVAIAPLDPWGYTRVWGGYLVPAHLHVNHPPLNVYAVWLGTRLFGAHELGLHLVFFAIALAAVAGTHGLARRLGAPPGLSALATVATPVFLVSATTLMSDTLFLATWVFAVVGFVDAIAAWPRPGGRPAAHRSLALCALATSACLMTRFNGVALVPLLAAYGLASRRRIEPWCLWLAPPVAVFGAYQWAAFLQHGHVPLRSAAEYAARSDDGLAPGMVLVVGLVYTGGCLSSAGFLAPLLWPRRALAAAAAAALAGALAVGLWAHPAFGLARADAATWRAAIQIGPWLVAGLLVAALALAELARTRDATALLLALWLAGTFAFATVFNWTVNARSILPMAPAAAILAARRIAAICPDDATTRRRLWLALVGAGALALAVAWADARQADAWREDARAVAARFASEPGKHWVRGSWGFQYYLEEAGFTSIDPLRSRLAAGDVVAAPLQRDDASVLPPSVIDRTGALPARPLAPLATMDAALGAGFYASATYGPLPFAFGPARSAGIGLFRVRQGFAYDARPAR